MIDAKVVNTILAVERICDAAVTSPDEQLELLARVLIRGVRGTCPQPVFDVGQRICRGATPTGRAARGPSVVDQIGPVRSRRRGVASTGLSSSPVRMSKIRRWP